MLESSVLAAAISPNYLSFSRRGSVHLLFSLVAWIPAAPEEQVPRSARELLVVKFND